MSFNVYYALLYFVLSGAIRQRKYICWYPSWIWQIFYNYHQLKILSLINICEDLNCISLKMLKMESGPVLLIAREFWFCMYTYSNKFLLL